jgi:predicted amidophosphoribosyltransferase
MAGVCAHGRSGCAYCAGSLSSRRKPQPRCPACGRRVSDPTRVCWICENRGVEAPSLFVESPDSG